MKIRSLPILTGWLLILGSVLINVPYALLISNFNYPDILRLPAGEILTAFVQGGSGLVFTWLAFAWSGLPILFAILLLPKVLGRSQNVVLSSATTLGVIGAIAQMIGLLRWVFVVPVLAQAYTQPGAGLVARASIEATFMVVHQFGGVLLGEHIGQAFTILWMALISILILRTALLPRWLGGLGLAASVVYFLAQGELLATVIPGFPQLGLAGLAGSLLWLTWMVSLGINFLRPNRPELEPALAG